MSSPLVCDNCGQQIRPQARFCPECGRPFQGSGQPDTDLPSPAEPIPAEPFPAVDADGRHCYLCGHGHRPGPHVAPPVGQQRRLAPYWRYTRILFARHHLRVAVGVRYVLDLPTQQQAANALAALLVQCGADRTAITQSVTAVEDCSANLSQDESVFSHAASSRQALLAKLAALPGGSTLPASMLPDLTTAWQASGQADRDFAKWTQDEIGQGCSSTNYQSDANFKAATVPDDQATKYKKAFAALWSQLASKYNLPDYQFNQI